MKGKKGQAALEFLMTYGWAILAAIVVIGALAYFGVFSPSTYVPNQCVASAPFGCNAGSASTTGVQLELVNGAGETLNVTSVDVSGCGTNSDAVSFADGEKKVISVSCTLASGVKFKGDITVTYRKADSAIDLTSSGTIVDKV